MSSRVLWIVALFAMAAFAATPTDIVGVVLESGSDLPLDGVDVTYRSGKNLGRTGSDGRFEFTVDSKNAVLVFHKEGFDSVVVELQDFADLRDMVVTLSSNLRDLGSSTVIGGGEPEKWEPERTISLDKLEDAAGMRFDLTEHLSQMPGISGQKDFSSALYYEGSRAGDVAYHLGRLRIPNMRHLDVGFPGNLSVVNPHILSGIEIHDHYGSGPIGQGLATSVQYLPEQTKGDWGLKGAAGLTVQEVVLDANVVTFRKVGLVNDDETEVGRVHLGVVCRVELDAPKLRSNEPDLLEARFRPVSELLREVKEDPSRFESWTTLALLGLFDAPAGASAEN